MHIYMDISFEMKRRKSMTPTVQQPYEILTKPSARAGIGIWYTPTEWWCTKKCPKKSCRMIWHGAHNYFNLVEPKFSENELTQARITYRMLHHFTTEKVLEWRKYEKKRLLIRCEIIIQFVDIIKSTTAGVCFNLP